MKALFNYIPCKDEYHKKKYEPLQDVDYTLSMDKNRPTTGRQQWVRDKKPSRWLYLCNSKHKKRATHIYHERLIADNMLCGEYGLWMCDEHTKAKENYSLRTRFRPKTLSTRQFNHSMLPLSTTNGAIPIYLTPPMRDPVSLGWFQQENCNTFHPTLLHVYMLSNTSRSTSPSAASSSSSKGS